MTMSGRLRVAVCGAGTMGGGIAQLAAMDGADVAVFDISAETLRTGKARVEADLRRMEAKGRLSGGTDEAMARIRWVDQVEQLGERDLVVEAVIEKVDIKRALFADLERVCGTGTILASNTSSLPIVQLARGLSRPEHFIGMHFFNPATLMKLVEVIPGPVTDPDVTRKVEEIARQWGKVAVRVADVPGFVVNRIGRPFHGEGFRAMQEGIAPALIDHLFRAGGGFRMGPLALSDLIGQDINFGTSRSIHNAYFGATRFVPHRVQASLVEGGLLGRKTGVGVFDYRGEAKGPETPAPDAEAASERILGETRLGDVLIDEAGLLVRVTRGATAAEESRLAGCEVAVVDWCAEDGAAIGFAASDAITPAVAERIAAFGVAPYRLPDRPGLLVARGVAQIANAAMDAVLEKVSDADGIDAAMRYGANYPYGPIEWARNRGREAVADMLRRIAHHSGLPMYLPSEQWSRL